MYNVFLSECVKYLILGGGGGLGSTIFPRKKKKKIILVSDENTLFKPGSNKGLN